MLMRITKRSSRGRHCLRRSTRAWCAQADQREGRPWLLIMDESPWRIQTKCTRVFTCRLWVSVRTCWYSITTGLGPLDLYETRLTSAGFSVAPLLRCQQLNRGGCFTPPLLRFVAAVESFIPGPSVATATCLPPPGGLSIL